MIRREREITTELSCYYKLIPPPSSQQPGLLFFSSFILLFFSSSSTILQEPPAIVQARHFLQSDENRAHMTVLEKSLYEHAIQADLTYLPSDMLDDSRCIDQFLRSLDHSFIEDRAASATTPFASSRPGGGGISSATPTLPSRPWSAATPTTTKNFAGNKNVARIAEEDLDPGSRGMNPLHLEGHHAGPIEQSSSSATEEEDAYLRPYFFAPSCSSQQPLPLPHVPPATTTAEQSPGRRFLQTTQEREHHEHPPSSETLGPTTTHAPNEVDQQQEQLPHQTSHYQHLLEAPAPGSTGAAKHRVVYRESSWAKYAFEKLRQEERYFERREVDPAFVEQETRDLLAIQEARRKREAAQEARRKRVAEKSPSSSREVTRTRSAAGVGGASSSSSSKQGGTSSSFSGRGRGDGGAATSSPDRRRVVVEERELPRKDHVVNVNQSLTTRVLLADDPSDNDIEELEQRLQTDMARTTVQNKAKQLFKLRSSRKLDENEFARLRGRQRARRRGTKWLLSSDNN